MRANLCSWLVFFVILGAALAGCKTTGTVSPVVHYRDSVRIVTEYKHDSIYRDRWHTQYIKGDTIYIKDSVFIDRWNIYMKHDTVRINKTDTVPQLIERELTDGQKFLIRSGWACWIIIGIIFVLAIIFAAVKLRKL